VKVLFLCGGIGKRMYPLSEDKLLLDFLGKTLLEHQISIVTKKGLKKLIFVCNPQNRIWIEEITRRIPDLSVEYSVQKNALGIANALECASNFLNDETLIVNPNDVFEDEAIEKLLQASRKYKADSYMLGYKVNRYFPGGYLLTNGQGQLTNIIEKPGEGNEPSDMVNILLHLHSDPQSLLNTISRVRTIEDDAYERSLTRMCESGKKIRVVPYCGRWVAIKYPWHILDTVRFFLDHSRSYISPTAKIAPSAIIDGKVVISDEVTILEHAVIKGPAYIGPRTVIGNCTLIRAYTHVGADCVVGFSTEIKGSYIDKGSNFHMNYVGDSIIGKYCNFGAGTIIANWRFDDKSVSVKIGDARVDTGTNKMGAVIGNNCKTGINASIMPGIKINPGSVIKPSQLVSNDING